MTTHESTALVHETVPPEPWLTADEVAVLAGLTPRTIRTAARSGRIPGERVRPSGGRRHRWRFRWAEVAEALTADPITETTEEEEKG
ncbi:helix-turn-helix domain-containing protein [Gordonia sp. PP30]|uniref:helix-turn-helix domain-containing protein n=1 Tax=Gordonia sp. PP30 TaxID=2935861 RepID=UPI001FFF37F1|nr:helix-turn-helix domain-containing protein [Gordonia sp. PP30]UQE75122.1 helix-turn-helix domain-containing protein [Gordonia sp. PP30]